MNRVTVYLRQPLFSDGGQHAHLPAGVMVIEGSATDRSGSVLTIDTARLLDARGRALAERSLTLLIPWAKVDHAVVHPD